MQNILKKILVLSLTVILMLSSISMALPSAHAGEIPAWIKNNAGWWAEGKIFDASFVSGIEWLITNGVVTVSSTEQKTKSGFEIPSWIKNNAGWWAEGLISDSAFISALEWLIDHGIVVVNLPQNVDPYDITFAPMLLNVAQQDLQYVTTTFFHVFGDLDSVQVIDGVKHWGVIYLGLSEDRMDEYNEVSIWNDTQKAAVVFPTFYQCCI